MGVGHRQVRRAVFLDRDGVIVEPVPDSVLGTYESPYRPEDVSLVPGVLDAICALKAAGFYLVGASNQPAAAKGNIALEQLRSVHERAAALLAAGDAGLDDWRYCFHHPAGTMADLAVRCDCRKPAPGLLRSAAADHGIDLPRSWMIGDSDSDVLAGEAAGTKTILIQHAHTTHRRLGAVQPTLTANDLRIATHFLVDRDRITLDCG